ncbi:MAG: MarR family transcriptional regulator [Eubacterium sp.]|jgi:MarR family 2-MHQ and catechol resistance regulon transcriptional repressor|uniref:MarR family winged helix-turn-helix transcriptional regulator n=1 Tax=Eubacterium sp. F2 TaxID=3381348 RepID=UPI003908224A|nr:MarR family transcriptional regulator [Eubacterium sp.]MCI2197547.1 MarR family transcriptional regulator [Eubacterium sp.]
MKDSSIIGLHRVVTDLDRETARISGRYGLTLGQFAVLEALYHKGDLTVGQVKEAILSSTGTIPVIINNLEKQNFVHRAHDPADRRRSIVQLTSSGRRLIEKVYPENEQMFRDKFSVWSKDEQRELLRLLLKYRDAVND